MFLSRLRGAIVFFAFSICAAVAQTPPEALPAVQGPPDMEATSAYFEQRLAAFGHWIAHPVWGQVWQPDAGRNFRPYFYGYWQYTSDYGWLWVSNEPYGDIVYHYGRWVYDPNFGWLWIPGYIWGPSWVNWRETDGYIGWLPMPPGYQDFSFNSLAPSYGPADSYGYQYFYGGNFPPDAFMGLWVFVPVQDFGRSDRRRYVFDRDRVRDLYRHSQDRTHYSHDRDSDRIVDRSIDKDELERSTRRHFDTPQGRQFLRAGTPLVSVTEGRKIAKREHDRNVASVRPDIAPGTNPPHANIPASTAEQGGRGFGRVGLPQFGARTGPEQDAQNPVAQSSHNLPRHEPERPPYRRNLPALDATGTPFPWNIPSTERSRAAQGSFVQGVTAPSAPRMGLPSGYRVPGGVAARSSTSAPAVGVAAPSMPPPAASFRMQSTPSIPAVQPGPAVAAPQAIPQAAGPQHGPRSGIGGS